MITIEAIDANANVTIEKYTPPTRLRKFPKASPTASSVGRITIAAKANHTCSKGAHHQGKVSILFHVMKSGTGGPPAPNTEAAGSAGVASSFMYIAIM